jgi:hypothetical protein
MKKFGFAAVTASALTAALLGLAGPAQASTTTAAVVPQATTIATGVDHLDWINDIQPKVNVPKVDTSVRHR